MLRYKYDRQDEEANRELRMLRELRENKSALQFTDVFPEYRKVLIVGCNELAVLFAKYLEELGISVLVFGQYWEQHGYKSCSIEELTGGGQLTVYAEGMPFQNDILEQAVLRSVSPEFECIDRIYEANVLAGNIRDTEFDFEELIKKLKQEEEIVVLGTGREAQDAYDLLVANGIDINCFAEVEYTQNRLLAKPVMSIAEAMQHYKKPIFINCKDTHGALGEEWTEYFDYRGYRRNQQYFLLLDYTDIPTSNLVHVLYGRNVLLAGDERLCELLSEYLNKIEEGNVQVRYIDRSEKVIVAQDDMLCLVLPQVWHYKKFLFDAEDDKETERIQAQLLQIGFTDYTEYFSCTRCFALIDLYLNKDSKKYSISQLRPKGILLGRIPAFSGNIFFRGIIDGHPQLLSLPPIYFNDNFFYYCIRLAGLPSELVLKTLWEILENEDEYFNTNIADREIFDKKAQSFLNLKDRFTSQELFVLLHAVMAENVKGEMIDPSEYVIYWEPHMVNREEFPFYALWLEDENVNGNTIVLCRNSINRTGSQISYTVNHSQKEYIKAEKSAWAVFDAMYRTCLHRARYRYWREYRIRFEDLKTKSQDILQELCNILHINWADSFFKTTINDRPYNFDGVIDFDLQPVFKKYEDWLSEFDRFRLSIMGSAYQKQYGYTYENCLHFNRRALQEMFFVPFLFEEKEIYKDLRHEKALEFYAWMRWKLWEVRKHMILDDVIPEFDRFELRQTGVVRIQENMKSEKDKSIEYIRTHDKIILYGIGNDCKHLLELMDNHTKEKLLYSDKRALEEVVFFEGKQVINPEELCQKYKDYHILVTASGFLTIIKNQFEKMGIDPSRVYYNQAGFGFEEENKKS